ncbi:MAG: hypothetical protein EXS08_03930 [Planctomycetes bacterium]|nr:hypothetical protein [Planctomycetota bacterium]
MHTLLRSRSPSALALLALAATARAQTGAYTLTDVGGSLPDQAWGEMGLADTGFVVSSFQDAAGHFVGFRWTPGARGAPSSLSLLDPPPGVAWVDYTAADVNNSGAVIGLFGQTGGGFGLSRGYVWKDGAAKELFTPLGFSAFPVAINDAGAIVGHAGGRPGGTPGAVFWTPDLVPSFVADLDAARDLNERGQVVGYRMEGATPVAHGYLWDGTSLTALGSLDPNGRGDVIPYAIDAQGRVVGSSEIRGVEHAFLWTAATGMQELAGLPNPNRAAPAVALDINDAGWIVGYTPDGQGIRDVLWGPDGSLSQLAEQLSDKGPGTRWSRLFWALRINSSGQVAGGALTGTAVRPVLLTPANLTMSTLVPGTIGVPNSLTVSGARPGKPVFVFGDLDDGLDQGFTRIPGRAALGLALATPRLVSLAVADALGQSTHAWLVPSVLGGLAVRLQALQPSTDALSSVVRATF